MKIRELFTGRVFTFSNFLSLSRILLVPVIWYYFEMESTTQLAVYKYYSVILIIVLMSTDYLDGFLARKLNQVSRLGQFIDPIADKISAISMGFILCYYKNFPLWILLVVIIRDLYMFAGGVIMFSKMDIQVRPNVFGRLMVACMPLAAFIYILSPDILFLGLSLQQISIFLILIFLILSTALSWRIYSKVYFEKKR